MTERLRLGVMSHDRSWPAARADRHMLAAFARVHDVSFVDVDEGWPPRLDRVPDLHSLDAVVTFIRYRDLMVAPPIDWAGYDGPRIQLEWDAWTDIADLDTRYRGTWVPTFRTHHFDHLLVSGLRLVPHFESLGVPVTWLAKGFDAPSFSDLGRPRSGIAHYGTLYRTRRAMLRSLRRQGAAVDHVSIPYDELADRLNGLAGVIACMLDAGVRGGKVGRALERRWPGVALRLGEDLEPMQKTFEIAAAGAVPLIPPSPDLAPLGFVDGETAMVWRDFDELAGLVRGYRSDPAPFAAVGRAAAVLSHARHTWDHRAAELGDIVRRLRAGG